MVKLSYKLPVFEGPLDLLLHLIAKHKLNINDIPIAQLLDQYMELSLIHIYRWTFASSGMPGPSSEMLMAAMDPCFSARSTI